MYVLQIIDTQSYGAYAHFNEYIYDIHFGEEALSGNTKKAHLCSCDVKDVR